MNSLSTHQPATPQKMPAINTLSREADNGIKTLNPGTETFNKTNALINEVRSVLRDRPGTDPDAIQAGVIVDSPVGRILFIVLNAKKVTRLLRMKIRIC